MAKLPPVLFVCWSVEQAEQMHAVARELGDADAWFLPCESGWFVDTIFPGGRERKRCLGYLRKHGLSVDLGAPSRDYGLVVTAPDLLLLSRLDGVPHVLLQDGPETPETQDLPGMRYDRVCVRDDASRDAVIAAGFPSEGVVVTGSDDRAVARIADLCRGLLATRSHQRAA